MTLDELERLVASKNHLAHIRFALVCQGDRPTYSWDAGRGSIVLDEFGDVFVSLNSVRETLKGLVARAATEHEKPRLDRASVVILAYAEAELDACDALEADIPEASQLNALKDGFAEVIDALFIASLEDTE
jgi:hypothetical protein